ncbi:hypothetical protein ACFLXA_02775 [Chloroflexota bacterium]
MEDLCLKSWPYLEEDVLNENQRQLAKWGIHNHDPFKWLAFVTEEVGEMAEAISEWHFRGHSPNDVVKEAIQSATLCLKIAEMFKYQAGR